MNLLSIFNNNGKFHFKISYNGALCQSEKIKGEKKWFLYLVNKRSKQPTVENTVGKAWKKIY